MNSLWEETKTVIIDLHPVVIWLAEFWSHRKQQFHEREPDGATSCDPTMLPHLARWWSESVSCKCWPVLETAKGCHIFNWSNECSTTSAMTPYICQLIICCLVWNIRTWKKYTGWVIMAIFLRVWWGIASTGSLIAVLLCFFQGQPKPLFFKFSSTLHFFINGGPHNHYVQQRSGLCIIISIDCWPVQWCQQADLHMRYESIIFFR